MTYVHKTNQVYKSLPPRGELEHVTDIGVLGALATLGAQKWLIHENDEYKTVARKTDVIAAHALVSCLGDGREDLSL